MVENVLRRDRLAEVARQEDEKVELAPGELERFSVAPYRSSPCVDPQRTDCERACVENVRKDRTMPERGAKAGLQLGHREGLRHVICAGIERAYLPLFRVICSDDDDRFEHPLGDVPTTVDAIDVG
jgi:hypothetical protein